VSIDMGSAFGLESRSVRADVRDLYESYADCLDELELERWPDYFTDDALYQVISRENYDQGLQHAAMYCDGIGMIKDRVVAIRQTTVYEPRSIRHFLSGVRIDTGEDGTILARGNFMITEALMSAEPTLLMVGHYVDVIETNSERLRFRERSCVYDNYRIQTSLIIPV
jgi:anthranilate 1,2-dioxygenase small subunit